MLRSESIPEGGGVPFVLSLPKPNESRFKRSFLCLLPQTRPAIESSLIHAHGKPDAYSQQPCLVLGKLDGVVGGRAAVLSIKLGQQVGHAVALPVPRLDLRAEARAGLHLWSLGSLWSRLNGNRRRHDDIAESDAPVLSIQHTEAPLS